MRSTTEKSKERTEWPAGKKVVRPARSAASTATVFCRSLKGWLEASDAFGKLDLSGFWQVQSQRSGLLKRGGKPTGWAEFIAVLNG